jgi:hypothetical protein
VVLPRLRSDIWVEALVRRCAVQGHFATILHRGGAEAGAVAVVLLRRDGSCELLSPPPGPAYDDEGERRFVRGTLAAVAWGELRPRLEKWRKTDPDLWVVEIEIPEGFAGLNIVES